MRFNVRCRNGKCRARHVFSMHPDHYKILPKCRMCGTNEHGFRIELPSKTKTCYCNGYWFPHRHLSPDCIHSNPNVVDNSQSFLDGLFDEVSV